MKAVVGCSTGLCSSYFLGLSEILTLYSSVFVHFPLIKKMFKIVKYIQKQKHKTNEINDQKQSLNIY